MHLCALHDVHIPCVCEVARALPTAADLNMSARCAARVRTASRAKAHLSRSHADRTRPAVHTARTHDAVLIDDGTRERVTRRRGHKDETAVRLDEPLVLDDLRERCFPGDNADLAVAVEVERHRFPRSERDRPLACDNDALVADIPAEESDCSFILRDKRAAVDDLPVRRAEEGVASRHKVGVRDVHRGRGERADVDMCARGKENARRVDEEHAPVRLQRAEDLGRVPAEDAVEQRRLCVRLKDIDALTRADVKRVPVDDGILRRLRDRHLRGVLRNLCGARSDLTALGQCKGVSASHEHKCPRRDRTDAAAEVPANPIL